jgi:DNA-binding transcriptional ArsR family regulator
MQLVRALASPTRIRILDAIADGPASLRELVSRMAEKQGVVSYHLKVLRATGCVRVAEPEPVSEAGERLYELAPMARPTRQLAPSRVRTGPGHPPAGAVRAAIERGTPSTGEDLFGQRQNQLSCTSMVVDEQGWREIAAAIGEAMDRISTAHEGSAKRLTEGEENGINATVAVASFESPGQAA